MREDMTPEDKLLKLIRNKDKGADAASPALLVANGNKQKIDSAAALKGKRGFFLNSDNLVRGLLSLKNLNAVLTIAVVLLFGYGLFELVFLKEGGLQNPKEVQEVEAKSKIAEAASKEIEPFDYYANQINKRDIFKSALERDKPSDGTSVKSTLGELAASLRLAGIIVDKEQPQVIIEDTKLKKTYFLYKGDSVGDIKVEEILEGKVILSYAGEKLELVP